MIPIMPPTPCCAHRCTCNAGAMPHLLHAQQHALVLARRAEVAACMTAGSVLRLLGGLIGPLDADALGMQPARTAAGAGSSPPTLSQNSSSIASCS